MYRENLQMLFIIFLQNRNNCILFDFLRKLLNFRQPRTKDKRCILQQQKNLFIFVSSHSASFCPLHCLNVMRLRSEGSRHAPPPACYYPRRVWERTKKKWSGTKRLRRNVADVGMQSRIFFVVPPKTRSSDIHFYLCS